MCIRDRANAEWDSDKLLNACDNAIFKGNEYRTDKGVNEESCYCKAHKRCNEKVDNVRHFLVKLFLDVRKNE